MGLHATNRLRVSKYNHLLIKETEMVQFTHYSKILMGLFLALVIVNCSSNDDDEDDTTGGGTGTGGGDGQPVISIGSGPANAFSAGNLAASTTDVAAGGTTEISVTLLEGNSLYTEAVVVNFTSGCASQGISEFDLPQITVTDGQATVEYRAAGCSGSDTVTAQAFIGSESIQATVDLDVEQDTVLGLEFVSVSESSLSLPGIGGNETTEVTFRLVGSLGAPIIGELVSFDVSSDVGGLTVAPGLESGTTNLEGEVSTTVQSGTVSTTFAVVATHNASGNQTSSTDIVISSGVPVDSRFSLSVTDFAPAMAYSTDNIGVGVNIIASDFFGNDVPDGTQVFFASPESGNIDSSCVLVSGECSVNWRSAGERGDYRATIIAYTDGAEDFTDINGNSVFDGADIFESADDLGEPFADQDDDGNYNLGEFFVDVNANGVRDAGNSTWDGPCLSAVDPTADCSGEDSVLVFKTADITMSSGDPVFSAVVNYDNGPSQAILEGGTIDTSMSPNGIARLDVTVASALGGLGLTLPSSTTIASSLEVATGSYTLGGSTSVTIPTNAVEPVPFTIVLTDTGPGVDESTTLTITVTLNGENKGSATWNVNFDNP